MLAVVTVGALFFATPHTRHNILGEVVATAAASAAVRIPPTWRALFVQRPDALFVGCLAAVPLSQRNPELEVSYKWGWLRTGALLGAFGVAFAAMAPDTAHKFFNHGGYLLIAAAVALGIVDLVPHAGEPDRHLPVYRAFRAMNLHLSNVVDVGAKVGVLFVFAIASLLPHRAARAAPQSPAESLVRPGAESDDATPTPTAPGAGAPDAAESH